MGNLKAMWLPRTCASCSVSWYATIAIRTSPAVTTVCSAMGDATPSSSRAQKSMVEREEMPWPEVVEDAEACRAVRATLAQLLPASGASQRSLGP